MKKVDLMVFDRTLEDVMLKDYPGVIKLEQYDKVVTCFGLKYYLFKDLDYEQINKFLADYNGLAYILSRDNQVLKVSNLSRINKLVARKLLNLLNNN